MIDIHKIIEQAVKKNATDIHLMSESKPIFRIGNSLVKMEGSNIIEDDDMNEIKRKLFNKVKSRNTVYESKDISLSVNLSFSNNVPVLTIKILKKELPEYEELQLPEILRKITHQTQGLILVVGNRKSGKTTTLNALVRHINETQNKKIITIEKLIEYKHIPRNSVIVQKQVVEDCGTYKAGVENALKEDCDVLVVEDIRNRETMEAVFEFVESGRLVIAGINATSCVNANEKIISFYEPKDHKHIKYLLSTLLKLVISQKLLIGTKGKLELISEVSVPNDSKQNVSLVNSLANLYVKNKITLKQAKTELQEKDIDSLNKTIMKMRIKK